MKKLSAILAALAIGALMPTPALGFHGDDHDCPDFNSQAEAQAYFESSGGSAANNVDDLDRNNNGVACEDQVGDADGARDETPATAAPAPTVALGAVPDAAMALPSAQSSAPTAALIALVILGVLMVRRLSVTR